MSTTISTTLDAERAIRYFRPDDLAKKYGGHRESKRSHEWLFRDPLCGSSRLRYNEIKQTWICWGCNRTGNAVRLVQLLERVDEVGALQFILSGYTGGENRLDNLESVFGKGEEGFRRKARKLPSMGLEMGMEILHHPANPLHTNAWEYLFSRGIDEESVRQFKIAFCRFGRLRNYIVFPCYMDRKIVYWQGRATWDPPSGVPPEERKRWVKETGYRKTLNPISSSDKATAEEVLFNYDSARVHPVVVVCEGPIDAIQIGPNAVATLGKSTGQIKIERLSQMAATHYVVYRDHSRNPDIAANEREITENLAEELSRFGNVSIATPPVGRDAGSFSRTQNAEIIAAAESYNGRTLQSVVT